jgi:hypothetical protein
MEDTGTSNTELRATMFQCMVRSSDSEPLQFNLRRMYEQSAHEDTILEVKAKAPGSLGKEVSMVDAIWKIGSLALRVKLDDTIIVSVFVFEGGKIKISGGSKGYHKHVLDMKLPLGSSTYDGWMENYVVKPVLSLALRINENTTSSSDAFAWELCLLNGSMSIDKKLVNITNYRQVCEALMLVIVKNTHPFFISATMPACYEVNGGYKRGRVCSTALSFYAGSKKRTLRFDHGGRVQYFAVKSFDDLCIASVQLKMLLENI